MVVNIDGLSCPYFIERHGVNALYLRSRPYRFVDLIPNLPLSHIPGPALAKMTYWWQNWHYFRGTWHQDILDLHEKDGRCSNQSYRGVLR
jgi:hypothetical protein